MKLFRSEETLRTLVIAAMMAALATSAGELAARVVPGFDPTLLTLLAFLVCLEGIAGDRLARQFPESSIRLRLHLVEWVVILAALRLVLSLSQGTQAFAAHAARWLARPQNLLDAGLATAGVLLVGVWWLGVEMSRCLEALGPEAESPPPKDSAAYYAWLTRPQEDRRGEGWERLRQLFLTGGVLLLICSGLARLDLQLALSLRHPAIAGIVGNALLYFILGFVLLAQGNYAVLQARWHRQEVPVAQPLGRRWAGLGIAFALLVALLVVLLPARPSLALFGAAFDAVWAVILLAGQIALTILAAFAFLLNLLLRLLGVSTGSGDDKIAPPAMPTPQPQPEAPPVGWWQAVQGLVLWAVLAAVLVYALVRFVRERRDLWAMLLARGGPLGWLVGLLAGLWHWLGGVSHGAGTRLQSLVARARSAAGTSAPRRRLRWPRPRSAREHVRLLYLLSLQETARLGRPRGPTDTPYEYAQRTGPELPEGGDELERMTGAFVEARYSPHDPSPTEIGPLRATYRRLRQACRRVLARANPVDKAGGEPTG